MKKIVFPLFILFAVFTLFAVDSVGYTIKVNGDVDLLRNDKAYDVEAGEYLFNGDKMECHSAAFAAIKFSEDNSIVRLFENSILEINLETDEKYRNKSYLKMGVLWAKVTKGEDSFEIATPTTVAAVKGTSFLLGVDEDGTTHIRTIEGSVEMRNVITHEISMIGAGEYGVNPPAGPITVSEFKLEDLDQDLLDIVLPEPEEIEPIEQAPIHMDTETEPEARDKKNRSSNDGEGFNMGGGVGAVMMGDQTYTQIRLMPEIRFGKFGMGLDIDMLIDSQGNIREEDWDDFEDYINKIYYIRYGQRGDTFYGRFGGFPTYTLGHGLLMYDYSNMLQFPEVRQLGLQLGGKLPIMGMEVEAFSSNIAKNDILAGTVSVLPLQKSNIPLLKNIKFGGNIVADRNQINGLIDTDNDEYPDFFDDYPNNGNWHNEVDRLRDKYFAIYSAALEIATPGATPTEEGYQEFLETDYMMSLRNPSFDDFEEDPITSFSLDYELPLINTGLFQLSHYGEAAQIVDHNMGFIFPGFYSKFLIFNLNMEYRIFQDDFAPSYFDNLYDQQRVIAYEVQYEDSTVVFVDTKESTLKLHKKSWGWYGRLSADIFQFITVSSAYEDMYGKNNYRNKGIWLGANLNTSFIPKLAAAEIEYSQKNFDKLTEFKTANAQVSGKLGYSLGSNTNFVGNYQERYVDLNGNGKISGKKETIKTMSFGVEFRF